VSKVNPEASSLPPLDTQARRALPAYRLRVPSARGFSAERVAGQSEARRRSASGEACEPTLRAQRPANPHDGSPAVPTRDGRDGGEGYASGRLILTSTCTRLNTTKCGDVDRCIYKSADCAGCSSAVPVVGCSVQHVQDGGPCGSGGALTLRAMLVSSVSQNPSMRQAPPYGWRCAKEREKCSR
jgi:hypothetical protein